MKAILVSIISAIGGLVAATATSGCLMFWIDEPEMPRSMQRLQAMEQPVTPTTLPLRLWMEAEPQEPW